MTGPQENSFPTDRIARSIYSLRDQRVILDSDLAAIYGVETRVLNQAVKRNPDLFPPEFMFQLTDAEAAEIRRLRSQSVILKSGRDTVCAITKAQRGTGTLR